MSPVLFYRTARPTAARLLHPRRNTGHLRMDVGNRSEPELHASDPCTAAASNWASGRHHQSRNLDRKLFSYT